MAPISKFASLLGTIIASSLNCKTILGFSIHGNQNNPFGILQKPFITSLSMARRRGRPRGPLRTIEVKPPMNEEIEYDELRVTVPNSAPNPDGKNIKDESLGILSKAEALMKAKELGGLDLILINENSSPPVAKIADYSKFRYEKEKKAKEAKKNAKASELKEIKMSYKIDIHDYGVRIKSASKFINQGNRVKCTVQFKGREVQHDKLGIELLERLGDDMEKICNMEGKPKRDGRNLSCILSPKPQVTKAVNDKKRRDEKQKKRDKRESKESKLKILDTSVEADDIEDEMESTADNDDDDTETDEDSYLSELSDNDDLSDDLFS